MDVDKMHREFSIPTQRVFAEDIFVEDASG